MRMINKVVLEMNAVLRKDDNYLEHYGTKRHSGRYPWGSGDAPYQHASDFYSRYQEMKKAGATEQDMCKYFELSSTDLRDFAKLAKKEYYDEKIARAHTLMEKGMSQTQAAKAVGIPESTLRGKKIQAKEGKLTRIDDVKEAIKKRVDEVGIVDMGESVEMELGCSDTMKRAALKALENEGYQVLNSKIAQVTNPDQKTNLILVARGDINPEAARDYNNIHSFIDYKPTTEEQFDGAHPASFQYPSSLDSSRVAIRYNTGKGDKNDGGALDGTIEIRRGVADLDLGGSNYAQVRVLVDGKYYLKGMAVYSDDLPEGKDVIFNTNKKPGTPMGDVFKPIKTDDPDNPFGTNIKEKGQSYYIDPVTGKHELSKINKCREEGDWDTWSRNLPPQFLAKQNLDLAKKQMQVTLAEKKADLDDILSIPNPVVREKLLNTFADSCDSNAVSLKTKALPGQRYQVILPLSTLKDNEIYAPNYPDGTKVSLVRYPHAGLFEIPTLIVNNRNPEGKAKITAGAKDAVGINMKVASILSGADFDGDTVQVLPWSSKVKISSAPPLSGLVGFDPKAYKFPDSMSAEEKERKRLKKKNIPGEMGGITNLIADMTLMGADESELTRAVKHSMVVIDAHKHYLDYKQSAIDNNIAELKIKYQGRSNAGASTLITKAGSQWRGSKRKEGVYETDPVTGKTHLKFVDPETGHKLYREAPEYYEKKVYDPATNTYTKTGKILERTRQSTKMAETHDARTLLPTDRVPTEMEKLYADYANNLKALANTARKESLKVGDYKMNSEAAKKYENEVKSLKSKYTLSKKNAPKERLANMIATTNIRNKVADNERLKLPENKEEYKKLKSQEIARCRVKVGASRPSVKITEKEWEAVENHAISKTRLNELLRYADMDSVKKMAMPKNNNKLTDAKLSLIKSYSSAGYTNAEIAEKLGISESTVIRNK